MDRPARVLAPLALLVLCGACCFGAASGDPDIDPTAIARLRGQLDCASQPFYCGALDRFEAGSEPVLASQSYAIVGRTFNVWTGVEEVDWFVATPGGGMGFGVVTPDDEEEQRELTQILAILDAGGTVPPAHPVATFVQSLAVTGDEAHATSVRGRSRSYPRLDERTEVYIRQSGTTLIAIEIDATGGAIGAFER